MAIENHAMRVRRVELPGSKVQDEMIFFNPSLGKYCSIDAVGVAIWEFLDGKAPSVSEICDYLLGEFEVDVETCQRDVSQFVQQMTEVGLLETINE